MENSNSMLCDIDTGLCETFSTQESNDLYINVNEKPIRIVYFTDPICSSCWGIEPQLRKLKLEYGHVFEIEYRMGGLLPDWSYNNGGIGGPRDVANHWDEVSVYYDMPIDGDIWMEDPMNSSYPPSIAFKAAQMQDEKKAVVFLRKIRELLFLEKKNIERWEFIAISAKESDLNSDKLKIDFEDKAKKLFEEDLKLAHKIGVRGFPTIFISNGKKTETIYGSKPYNAYEKAIIKLSPKTRKKTYETYWENIFGIYPSLTAKEFFVLSGKERREAEKYLNELVIDKKLNVIITKNGNLYKI